MQHQGAESVLDKADCSNDPPSSTTPYDKGLLSPTTFVPTYPDEEFPVNIDVQSSTKQNTNVISDAGRTVNSRVGIVTRLAAFNTPGLQEHADAFQYSTTYSDMMQRCSNRKI